MVLNPAYRKGISSSIRSGMTVLDPKSVGILIALGDQPFVKAQTINALIKAFKNGKGGIIVPSFKGKRGHPVIFHRRYAKELLRLEGDVGGKRIIESHPHDVWEVPVKSEGVVKDIDTWNVYKKELRRKS
jgi:molybdenum cofactor cytidylyltransferase